MASSVRTILWMTALMLVAAEPLGAAEPAPKLDGCWSKVKPAPRCDEASPGAEWGVTEWCFRKRGKLETSTLACSIVGDCDGWDNEYRYKLQGRGIISIGARGGIGGTGPWTWSECLVNFDGQNQMTVLGCDFASGPWRRGKQDMPWKCIK